MKHREPALLAFPVAILNGDQLLAAVFTNADQHERAQAIFLEADTEMHSVSPDVGEALRSDVPIAEPLVLLLPLGR